MCAMMPSELGGKMSAEITPEIADDLTTEVIHFLQAKYPGIDMFDAMEALISEWNDANGEFAQDADPTAEEDADFEASYARATAAVEEQQSLEDLPPLRKKKCDVN